MQIHVGTSGFSYHHWATRFYPKEVKQAEWLQYYSRFFDTVELNVTFYRTPKEEIFEKWYADTPKGFTFAIKGSRYITHVRRLEIEESSLDYFIDRTAHLKEKIGPVLWQLPPFSRFDPDTLSRFLKLLKKTKFKNALEPRHMSWFSPDAYKMLEDNNVALVIADSPAFPKREILTADFAYIRFHGGSKLYGSEYSGEEMDIWSEKISGWAKNGEVFAYFNNDANAFAVRNAQQLKA